MEGNDDDEEGLFAPMMILLKRVFVIGNTSTHTREGVLFLSFFLGVCPLSLVEKCVVINRVIIGSKKTFFAFF